MTKVLEDVLATETEQHTAEEIAVLFDEVVAELDKVDHIKAYCLKIDHEGRRVVARQEGREAPSNGNGENPPCRWYCSWSNGTTPPCADIGKKAYIQLKNGTIVQRNLCNYGVSRGV